MVLNILQCTGQPPQERIMWPKMSNINSTTVEKPGTKQTKYIVQLQSTQTELRFESSWSQWGYISLLIKNADYGALTFPFLSPSHFPFNFPFFLSLFSDMKETYLPSSPLILDFQYYFKVVRNVVGWMGFGLEVRQPGTSPTTLKWKILTVWP